MNGQVAFQAMTNIQESLILESAYALGYLGGRDTAVNHPRPERRANGFVRFMGSGWGVAMICALVSAAALGFMIWAGNRPTTVGPAGSHEDTETESPVEEIIPAAYEDTIELYAKIIEICSVYDDRKAAEGIYADELGLTEARERELFEKLLSSAYLLYPGRGMADAQSPYYMMDCGYALKDLNGDGAAELFLLNRDFTIVAVFSTSAEGGEPILLDHFKERRSCWIDGEGLLHVGGSGSATASEHGIYRVASGGQSLETVTIYGRDEEQEALYYRVENGERMPITAADYNALHTYRGISGHRATKTYAGLRFCSLFGNVNDLYITEAEALEIAADYWGISTGEEDPATGKHYLITSLGKTQTSSHGEVYRVVKQYAEDNLALDVIWIHAESGEVVMSLYDETEIESAAEPETPPETTPPAVQGSEGLEYRLNPDGESYTLYGMGSCRDTHIIIPAAHKGYPVTAIGNNVFAYQYQITSVEIPDSVTSIGNQAFAGCTALTEIRLPEGLTSIGIEAFHGCGALTSLVIPEGVTVIRSGVFGYCSALRRMILPEGLTSIGEYAFLQCSELTEIDIPEGVDKIGQNAFYNCSALTRFTIPDGVTEIRANTFYSCTALTSVVIPDGVHTVEENAFAGCSALTHVTLPDSLKKLGDSVFSQCYRLREIILPEGVTKLGDSIFQSCYELTSVKLPVGLTAIPIATFAGCHALREITIPAGVTVIGERAFLSCKALNGITLPEGVTEIGNNAFNGCGSLTEMTFPEGLTTMGVGVFRGCSGLTAMTIPHGVTSIRSYTFDGCTSLRTMIIPDSVTVIKDWAFGTTYNLTDIHYTGTEEDWHTVLIEDGNSPLTAVTMHFQQ